ncbi:hypothetical protein TONV_040 [Tipula oleracea nudivirus]|uniref:Uncharacterized protein n=1 Tax=Tipula oleracea nudivirus TaxID=1546257 RepID=A0A0B4VFD1_9VIRU|nr:hypothetical protein TONV_040 [Tipula oleracea nudivirus]AJD20100.1 hypothetical protein TONV_040 [Tipula oleracea nudivirus]
MIIPTKTLNRIKNIKNFEEFNREFKNNSIQHQKKIIEINGNKYYNNWYSNVDDECKFKVQFTKDEVKSDDDLYNLTLKNSAKFLPNLHFINIKNPRLFKIE